MKLHMTYGSLNYELYYAFLAVGPMMLCMKYLYKTHTLHHIVLYNHLYGLHIQELKEQSLTIQVTLCLNFLLPPTCTIVEGCISC